MTLVRGASRGREVVLSRDLRRELKRGHPWVYADAVRLGPNLEPGEIVTVLGGDGRDKRAVGRGYVDPQGPLAVRMCSLDRGAVDDAWAEALIERAIVFRTTMFSRGDTTGYRLINGEGDGLPGLVVDRYGDTLVIKTDGPIADAFWDVDGLASHLAARLGVTSVYGRVRSRGGAEGRALVGPAPSGPIAFSERGLAFEADVVSGQKTGFFFDQRDNRTRVGELARGRRVLNAFGYTGGFSVHAGKGGATHVTTLDLARPAIEAAETNWRKNGLPPEAHAGVVADVFEHLDQTTDRWDLIVLDPPAFAPGKQALPQALAAYRRVVTAGARVATADALMLVASCSAHVRMHDLMAAVEEGIGDARRRATLLFSAGQPPDHPSPLACPELAYLKAIYLRLA